jgi:hypothetical protein
MMLIRSPLLIDLLRPLSTQNHPAAPELQQLISGLLMSIRQVMDRGWLIVLRSTTSARRPPAVLPGA